MEGRVDGRGDKGREVGMREGGEEQGDVFYDISSRSTQWTEGEGCSAGQKWMLA